MSGCRCFDTNPNETKTTNWMANGLKLFWDYFLAHLSCEPFEFLVLYNAFTFSLRFVEKQKAPFFYIRKTMPVYKGKVENRFTK